MVQPVHEMFERGGVGHVVHQQDHIRPEHVLVQHASLSRYRTKKDKIEFSKNSKT